MFARVFASAALAGCLVAPAFAENSHAAEPAAEAAPEAASQPEAPAPQMPTDLNTVLATVGDTDITLGELLVARTQLPAQFQQIPSEQLFDALLTQLIQQQLLSDSLQSESPRIELTIKQEARSLRAGEAVEKLADSEITEEAVGEVYEQIVADLDTGVEYHAAHILVETKEEADAILDEVLGGADFAETARAKSTGPSGPSGGDLGWFGTGMMVPEFEEAVLQLAPGDVSDPVETQFGWHVIKLLDTRDKALPTLEELRGEIEGELLREAIDARVAELESGAHVARTENIDPTVISHTELLNAE